MNDTCPYCNINLPLEKHDEELYQWHLNGHKLEKKCDCVIGCRCVYVCPKHGEVNKWHECSDHIPQPSELVKTTNQQGIIEAWEDALKGELLGVAIIMEVYFKKDDPLAADAIWKQEKLNERYENCKKLMKLLLRQQREATIREMMGELNKLALDSRHNWTICEAIEEISKLT